MFSENIFKKSSLFIILMIISALGLASTAAYYSVYGLSSLFAGSKVEVIIMASALEFSKLVIASYLHNHWNRIGLLLKSYLTIGVVILMLITSAGIYGFLTSAYQTTSMEMDKLNNKIELIEKKRDRYQLDVSRYITEQSNLSNSINELSKGLSNNVIQYKDNATGNIITTTSSATRNVLTNQLEDFKSAYTIVSDKVDVLNDSITQCELSIITLKSNSTISAELGPLLYLKDLTGKPMGDIVNWFTLLIVIVFDPLAIAMIIALNKYIHYISDTNINTPSINNEISSEKTFDKIFMRKRERKS
jgi:hypothetical protein